MDVTSISSQLRRLALLLFVSTSTCLAADIDAANQAFDAGKFDDAKQQYQALLQQGSGNANVYYNLGNAEFRLNAPGRAILEYERALVLDPTHPEARRNLSMVREKTGARVFESNWYDALTLAWRADTYVIVCSAAAWIAAFALGCLIVLRRGGSGLVFSTVIAIIVAGYGAFGVWYTSRDRNLGIVLPKEAVARVAPADQSSISGTLPAGSRVRILSVRGDWVYCALPGDSLGWFPATAVERVRLNS